MALVGRGGWGEATDRVTATQVLRRAAALGVQLFDTADSYGPHVSEELIRHALHPYGDGIVIATKGGSIREGAWQLRADGRPEHLRAACEGSLRRLAVDRIDLYQLHRIDPAVPLEESLGALAELRAAGKIRHIGLSNVTIPQIEAARQIVPIVSVQNEYSLAVRDGQDAVVDYCTREGLAYLPWEPLAKGLLARAREPLATVAERRGVTPAQAALAWLLLRAPVVLPIPGTVSPAHVEQNVASLACVLSPEDLTALEGYRPPRIGARQLVRRFVPPRLRHAALSALRIAARN
jgi:pyridoxine 4-dehydrogenase